MQDEVSDNKIFLDSIIFCINADDSLRTTAKKIGVSSATLHRVLSGKNMDAVTFAKILIWMCPDNNTLRQLIKEVSCKTK